LCICVLDGICVNHVRRVAGVYMCINNRYFLDMVHTYTTKHTTATLLTWFTHIHYRYSPDMVHTFGGIGVNHMRRAAVVYICVWWHLCEPCQESSGCVYVCLVVYV
jgi:hypothetical protein